MKNPDKLISWLKYLDVEYLDDASCEALAKLNINNIMDQDKIIDLAMKNEIVGLNEISRSSLLKILDELPNYPEIKVREIMERVGMPFDEPLIDYLTFFRRVRENLSPQ